MTYHTTAVTHVSRRFCAEGEPVGRCKEPAGTEVLRRAGSPLTFINMLFVFFARTLPASSMPKPICITKTIIAVFSRHPVSTAALPTLEAAVRVSTACCSRCTSSTISVRFMAPQRSPLKQPRRPLLRSPASKQAASLSFAPRAVRCVSIMAIRDPFSVWFR